MEIKNCLVEKAGCGIHSPEDSIAMVVWSIRLKSATFHRNADDVIYAAMEKIEDTLKDDMTARAGILIL